MSISREVTFPQQIAPAKRLIAGLVVFVLLAVVGLLIVKWAPYWTKAHIAAAQHSIGVSIVSGKAAQAPAVGWQAAWGYAAAYFKSVWEAVVLALILGASVQVFVPRRWLHRMLGQTRYRSAALAGLFSVAGMM
jgi:uncharacterized membrane protein YraQ (UPF0718 family)